MEPFEVGSVNSAGLLNAPTRRISGRSVASILVCIAGAAALCAAFHGPGSAGSFLKPFVPHASPSTIPLAVPAPIRVAPSTTDGPTLIARGGPVFMDEAGDSMEPMIGNRRAFIAGNWKMNTVLDEAKALATAVSKAAKFRGDVDVAVCVPYPFLAPVKDVLKGSSVGLGAQDCYDKESGAYTGAVSTAMLKSVGTDYVLAGHSERRVVFGESDAEVNAKVLKILEAGIGCILCIGEQKDERESGKTFDVCNRQLTEGLKGVTADMMENVVIAYEPVWAIGTGLTATPEVAQETHKYIRQWFVDEYGEKVSQAVIIQYGGSVNDKNVDDLMCQKDIDGALVGGASLNADGFTRIINHKAPTS